MIETIVRLYLSGKLNCPVYVGEKPANLSKEYVVIETLDIGRTNHIDAVTLDLYSYSTSGVKSAELNERVKEAMFDIVEVENISGVRLSGGGQSIDTQSKTNCYDCVFNLFYTN